MTIFLKNRQLLEDFREGKKDALQSVYQSYRQDVERFVSCGWISKKTKMRSRVNFSGDNDLRIELIQEVFLRAFSKNARVSYDGVRLYRNYLLTLARNVVVDYVNAHPDESNTHVSVDMEIDRVGSIQILSAEDDPYVSPEESLNWQRCVRAMREYVAALDDTMQQFVQLRFRQELTLLEVARRLNISRGKARHMEKQLGRELKSYLEERHLISSKEIQQLTAKLNNISVSTP
ncbi:MAG: sigma-70 family RNA polymerase sigma factor [Deltaproteobacteria bacterium]|nr:sigma-70 family RNA polymerase sigma factor [Deltaproteobacteria bacterium]